MAELTKKQKKLLEELTEGTYKAPSEQRREKRDANLRKQQSQADIAPVKSNTSNNIAPIKKDDGNWFANLIKNTVKPSEYFNDGYQFGDITKTAGKTIGHIGSSIVEGGYGVVEGLTDLKKQAQALGSDITSGVTQKILSGVIKNKTGMNDESSNAISGMISNAMSSNAIKNTTHGEYSSAEELRKSAIENDWDNSIAGDIQEKLREGSVAGSTTEKLGNLVGYTGASVFGGKALGKAGEITLKVGGKYLNMPTLAITTGTAQSLNESYSKDPDVSNVTAWSRGITSGLIEGATEGMFGFLGVGGSSLDDIGTNAIKEMSEGMGKKLATFGIPATGEAIEELIGYTGNQLADLVVDKADGSTNFHEDWDWEEVGESMVLAFVSTGISQGGSSVANAVMQNMDINEAVNQVDKQAEEQLGRKLTKEERKEVKEQLKSYSKGQNTEIPTQEDIQAQIEEKVAEQEQTQDIREKEIIQDEIDILQEEANNIPVVEEKTKTEQLQEAKQEAKQIVEDISRNIELEQQAQTAQEQQEIRNRINELESQLAPLQEQLEQDNSEVYSKEITELEDLKAKYTNASVVKAIDNQINKLKSDSEVKEQSIPATQESAETQSTEALQNITDEDITNNPVDENTPLSNDVAISEGTTDVKTKIKETFGLKPKQTTELYNKVANVNSVEQVREVLEEYKDINETYISQEIRDAKKYLKTTGIDTSKLKTDHKNELMKSAGWQVKFSKNGLPVDQVYQELSAKYPDLFDPNIANEADQFERIVDFVTSNKVKNTVKVGEISNEDLNGLAEELYAEVHANEFNNDTEYQNSLKDLDSVIDQEALKEELSQELKTQVNDIKDEIASLKSLIQDSVEINLDKLKKDLEQELEKIEEKVVNAKTTEEVDYYASKFAEIDETLDKLNIPETDENIPISNETLQVREDLIPSTETAQNSNTELTDTSIEAQEIQEHEKHTGMKVEKQDGGAKLTKILTDMPENIPENKIGEYLEMAGIKLLDKGFTVKNEALKYKNQALEEKYNQIKHANREAVNMAMDGYTEFKIDLSKSRKDGRIQSEKKAESIENILKPIKNDNETAGYYDYMYNQLNVDRMSIESNAQAKIDQMLESDPILKELNKRNTLSQIEKKIVEGITQTNIDEIINQELFEKNNDLFKSKQLRKEEAQRLRDNVWEIVKLKKAKNKILLNTTAEQSQEHLKQYEGKENFKKAEDGTRTYIGVLQDLLVDGDIISTEQKDHFNELYPHYIPAFRDVGGQVVNVNYFGNNITPTDAVGKAKGGTQDILPLDHSLMVKTKQTIHAVRMNKYLLELKNTYEKNGILNVINSETQNLENTVEESTSTERVSKTEDGKYTATVYEKGKKTVFEISKGQYEALKPSDIPVITTLNTFVDIKRALLTQYNLYFATRNFWRDMPTAYLQSQDSNKWFKNIPEAVMQVAKKGQYQQLLKSLGGGNNDYSDMNNIGYGDISPINTNADNKGNKFSRGWEAVKDWKGVKWIAKINDFVEQVPRMAEFITAIDNGKSLEGAVYAQDEVTVNFGKGGDWTKTADRNVTNFVNANMQGLYKIANVFRDSYAYGGKKALAKTITKYVLAGGSMVALMGMAWDDDEDYEELSDYIKQNYYVLGKYGDGKFIKIPKGRTNAVIEDLFNEGISVLKGEKTVEEASKDFMSVVSNNLAPNSLVESSIFAGIYQTLTNTSWYGEDIVPTRLQKEEAKDQYDETTDAFSIWLGQKTGLSPYKIDYLLDQSTGFLGDMILPLLTEQAETPIDNPIAETFLGQFYKDYTGDSTIKNQNITDIYELTDEGSDLYVKAHKSEPDTDSIMQYKYLTTATARMNELYKEKRTIQAETGLSNSEKSSALREVQRQIDDIAKNALDTYENIDKTSSYYSIEGIEYYKNINSDGEVEWRKVDEEELEKLNSLEMDINDKTAYFNAKVGITEIDREYEANREDLDEEIDADRIKELSNKKKSSVIDTVMNTDLTDKQKELLYTKYYSTEETVDKILDNGTSMNTYLQFEKDTIGFEADKDEDGKSISGSKSNKYEEYLLDSNMSDNDKRTLYEYSVLGDFESEDKHKDYKIIKTAGIDINSYLSYASQTFTADKKSNGKTISGSRKNKVFDYINSLDLSIPQKAIMFKAEYNSEDSYNNQIIDYVDTLSIDYEEKIKLVTDIGMKVDKSGRIWW